MELNLCLLPGSETMLRSQRVTSLFAIAEAVVFDLIRVWRVDSGDYRAIAGAIMDTWELRNSQLSPPEQLSKPLLMNSNLSSVEDIEEASRCRFLGLPPTSAD